MKTKIELVNAVEITLSLTPDEVRALYAVVDSLTDLVVDEEDGGVAPDAYNSALRRNTAGTSVALANEVSWNLFSALGDAVDQLNE